MSVLSRILISSQERIDLQDFLAIDSFSAYDFKAIIDSLTGGKTFIVKGLDVISPSSCIGSTSLSINIADCIIYSPNSHSGPFFQGLPEGHELAQPLVPILHSNSINYIYAVLSTKTTASDLRAFWNPDTNSETIQEVDTQTILVLEVGTSTSSFPEGTIPICKVTTSNVITSITDCRELFYRLGQGNIFPDPYYQKTLSVENPITITKAGGANPFVGGDKDIKSLKDFIDIVASRIKEITGATYWYSSTPTSIKNIWWQTLASTIKSKGEWIHDQDIEGKLSWNSDIHIVSLTDERDIILRKGSVILQNKQVAFLKLDQEKHINNYGIQVEFVNDNNFINTDFPTAFENLNIGDWVKASSDSDSCYVRVEGFYLNKNLGGGVTDKSQAKSIKLSKPYKGTSKSDFCFYSKGEYTESDVIITNRDDNLISNLGDKYFWIATRDDNICSISSIEQKELIVQVLTESSGRILCKCNNHNLIDGDWITIPSGDYTGTYQVEIEDENVFSIESSMKSSFFTAYYGLITTGKILSQSGFELEDEFHRFDSSSSVIVILNNNSLQKRINIREPNIIQTHLSAESISSFSFIYQPRITVRKEFGATKIVQGTISDIEEERDLDNIMKFLGMKNINEKNPTYSTPSSYNTLIGRQSFNTSDSDSVIERLSKLTSMMADRVQDRSIIIKGRSVIRNIQNGNKQVIYLSQPMEVILPSSPKQIINAGAFELNKNSIGYIFIDRNKTTSQSISVEEISASSLDENKIILFYRLDGEEIYTWNGNSVLSGSSFIHDSYEDSSSKNIYMVNSGRIKFNPDTGLIVLEGYQSEEISKVVTTPASEIPPNCFFVISEANDLVKYYIWLNVNNISTDPNISGMIGIEVPLLSSDNANTVAAKLANAISNTNRFEVSRKNNEVIIRNKEAGPATDIYDGDTPTPFDLFVVQQGSRFNIDIIVSGSDVKNTVDAITINTTEALKVKDGYSAWVFVSKTEDKVFNNISTNISSPDTGTIYITKTSEVPAGQNVFVLWSNVGNRIIQVHNAAYTEENIYEEHLIPTQTIPTNSIIELPRDSLDDNNIQYYIVGSSMLEVYLNGNLIIKGVHWEEVGEQGLLSDKIKTLIDLEPYDRITFRIDSKGSVYFTAPSEFQTDPFLRPSLNTAYNTGNVISVIDDRPVSIYGNSDKTLLEVGGNSIFKVVSSTANHLLNNTSSKLTQGFGIEVVSGSMFLKDANVTKQLKELLSNPLEQNEDILIMRNNKPNRLPISENGKFLSIKNNKLSYEEIKWDSIKSFNGSSIHDLQYRYHSDLFNSGLRSHAEIDAHLASVKAHGIKTGFVDLEEQQTLKNKTLEGVTIEGGFSKPRNHIWSDNKYLNIAGSINGVKIQGTSSIVLPKGTTLDRPQNPEIGSLRYNTQISLLEVFNGQNWEAQRSANIVETPSIISPSNQSTIPDTEVQIEASPYYNIYNRMHVKTDWQVSTDVTFSTIVFESLNDITNLTSIKTTELAPNQIYYVRVRYKDSQGNVSYWSSPSEFLVASQYVERPEIISPSFGEIVDVPIDVMCSSFSATSTDIHTKSHIQIALDSLFINTIYDSGEINATTTFQIPRVVLNPLTQYWIRVRYKGENYKWSYWSVAKKVTTSENFKYAVVNDISVINPFNLTQISSMISVANRIFLFGTIATEQREYVRSLDLSLSSKTSVFSDVVNNITNHLFVLSRTKIEDFIYEILFDNALSQLVVIQRSQLYQPVNAKIYNIEGFTPIKILSKNRYISIIGKDEGRITFVKLADPSTPQTFDDIFTDYPQVFSFSNDYDLIDIDLDKNGNYIILCKNSSDDYYLVAISENFSTSRAYKLKNIPKSVKFKVLDNDYVVLVSSFNDISQNHIEIFSSGLSSSISTKRYNIEGSFIEFNSISNYTNGFILTTNDTIFVFNYSGIFITSRKWEGISSPIDVLVNDSQVIIRSNKSILALDKHKLGPIGLFPSKPYQLNTIELAIEGWNSGVIFDYDLLTSFLGSDPTNVSLINSLENIELDLQEIEPIDSKDEF